MPESRKESTMDEAIRSAKDRGMVPFVLVYPVAPEFLRDAAGPVDQIVGQAAGEEIAKQVRAWQQEDRVLRAALEVPDA